MRGKEALISRARVDRGARTATAHMPGAGAGRGIVGGMLRRGASCGPGSAHEGTRQACCCWHMHRGISYISVRLSLIVFREQNHYGTCPVCCVSNSREA